MTDNAPPLGSIRLKTILEEVVQEHGVPLQDVRKISSHVLEKIIAELSEGKRVKLGQLGTFRPGAKRGDSMIFKYVKKIPAS